jgi:tetratricopeptide (TPR) repeat protein
VENAKKKAAEMEAERKRIEAENAKAQELNTKLPEILKAANDAFTAKRWDEAIAKYNEGMAADPTQSVFPRNKAIALRTRAIEKFNASVKSKDQAGKEAARNDLKDAVEAAEKAVANFREGAAKRGGGAAPGSGGSQQNEELGLLEIRAETYRLALQTSSPVDSNAAAKAIEEYLNVEGDANKKNKMEASLGDALFFAGKVDESIAKFREILARNSGNFDAMFGLGISLAAKSAEDPTMVAEAKKTLEQFVSKVPDGYPRKADAAEAVAYLEESLKSEAASKAQQDKNRNNQRRRP